MPISHVMEHNISCKRKRIQKSTVCVRVNVHRHTQREANIPLTQAKAANMPIFVYLK